ncbi:MAG: DUF2147 domain-containing protein [Pseudomonadota bacterium]
MRIFTILALLAAAPAWADGVTGIWKTEPGDTGGYLHVRLGPCSNDGALTCGVIDKAFDGDGAAIANYANLGKPIVWNMQNPSAGQYRKGKIWAPDRDKTYNSKMDLSGATLTVQGCVLAFCRGQTWTKVQ